MYAISPKGNQARVTSLAGPLKTCLLLSLLLEGQNNHCHVRKTGHFKYLFFHAVRFFFFLNVPSNVRTGLGNDNCWCEMITKLIILKYLC